MHQECGVTRVSLENFKNICLSQEDAIAFLACEYRDHNYKVYALICSSKPEIVYSKCEFTGFSWGYHGEGVRGFQEALRMLDAPDHVIDSVLVAKRELPYSIIYDCNPQICESTDDEEFWMPLGK